MPPIEFQYLFDYVSDFHFVVSVAEIILHSH